MLFQKLMHEQGIQVRLNATVTQLHATKDHITSMELASGENIACDLVVSNVDPAHLYQHMVSPNIVSRTAKLKTKFAKKSMGLFVLFFGTDTTYPDVEHHTIWLGPRYKDLWHGYFQSQGII